MGLPEVVAERLTGQDELGFEGGEKPGRVVEPGLASARFHLLGHGAGPASAEAGQRTFQAVGVSFDRFGTVFLYAGTDMGEKARAFREEDLHELAE